MKEKIIEILRMYGGKDLSALDAYELDATPDRREQYFAELILDRIKSSLPSDEEIEEESKDYDSACYYSHNAGEEPIYHHKVGAQWARDEIKRRMQL